MKKFYYLSTCDTCKRIMKELDLTEFIIIDIKKNNISTEDIELVREHFESYTDLFNKRARKIKELGINLSTLQDDEIKHLILGEYSFLKRPLLISDNTVLAGNSRSIIEKMKELHGTS